MSKGKANRAEELAYKALIRAINGDNLLIYLDESRINRPQSPVYDPWETLLPILIPMIFGLILMLWVGIIFGLLFIIGITAFYSSFTKKKLQQLLLLRTKKYIISGYENFTNLWDFGGFVLVNATDKKIGCIAPDGNWKEFIAANFAELMLDKTQEKPEEKESDETPKN